MQFSVKVRKYSPSDLQKVYRFLRNIPDSDRHLFGPHDFDYDELKQLLQKDDQFFAYLGLDKNNELIAYQVLKKGLIDHDKPRLSSYPVDWDTINVCTYAPYIKESMRGVGIGSYMLEIIVRSLKKRGFDHLVLWGGVRNDNIPAFHFYINNRFQRLGEFHHNGINTDMILTF